MDEKVEKLVAEIEKVLDGLGVVVDHCITVDLCIAMHIGFTVDPA